MLALQAVLEQRATAAMVLLLVTQLIDGIDGPMARATSVKERVPKIDGYVLDLVIDFVTCVIVPAAFIYQFHLLPARFAVALVGLAVFTSAIWFSRTDMMTPDYWFRGFPAVWNLAAPTLYLLHVRQGDAAIVVILLSVASLTDLPFPHPVRAVWMRPFTLTVTVLWLTAMTLLVFLDNSRVPYLRIWLLVGPLVFVGLMTARLLGLDQGSAVSGSAD